MLEHSKVLQHIHFRPRSTLYSSLASSRCAGDRNVQNIIIYEGTILRKCATTIQNTSCAALIVSSNNKSTTQSDTTRNGKNCFTSRIIHTLISYSTKR